MWKGTGVYVSEIDKLSGLSKCYVVLHIQHKNRYKFYISSATNSFSFVAQAYPITYRQRRCINPFSAMGDFRHRIIVNLTYLGMKDGADWFGGTNVYSVMYTHFGTFSMGILSTALSTFCFSSPPNLNMDVSRMEVWNR